jgi:hypothetical protein
MSNSLTVPAVKGVQKGRTLFLFTLDGKRLHNFAAVALSKLVSDFLAFQD